MNSRAESGATGLVGKRVACWRGRLASVFTVFGRVPMFFYLLRVPLIHVISVLAVRMLHGPDAHVGPGRGTLPGYEPSLLPVHLDWLAVVAALYPLCRWYAGYKARNKRM